MRRSLWFGLLVLASALALAALPAAAQQRGGGQQRRPPAKVQSRPQPQRPAPGGREGGSARDVGGGYIPAAPPRRPANARPEPTRPADHPGHPEAPHVDSNTGVWVGRTRPGDPRYRLAHPWRRGHFPGVVGARQIWRLEGGGPARFWFGGYIFMVAPADLGWCSNWWWNRDDIVLYLDPDQPGWYIAYNVRLGTWCHVEYLGIL